MLLILKKSFLFYFIMTLWLDILLHFLLNIWAGSLEKFIEFRAFLSGLLEVYIILAEFGNHIRHIIISFQEFCDLLFQDRILLDIFIEFIAKILDLFPCFFEIASQFIHGISMLISEIEHKVSYKSTYD